jgi:hypothetical protein
MTVVTNPFDVGGYSLAEMTQAINILPNVYTRLGQMGLFRFEGITQRSALIEQAEGVLNLLPTVPLGGAATVANRDTRSMRSFTIPWIPHDDVITPQDVQGVRGFGVADAADPLATVMERKLTRMRAKHAQTREYMEINALRGIVKDGAGTTLYNYFTEFGLEQQAADFVLGTAGTNIQAKVRDVLRKVETELKGETMTGALALVSPEFFDKLIGHAKVEDAYKYYSSTGAQPLREDTRRRFPFAGILFEEYNATVTLSTGATETLIPAGEGRRRTFSDRSMYSHFRVMISFRRQPVRINSRAARIAEGSSMPSHSISRSTSPMQRSSAALRNRSRFSSGYFLMCLRGFEPSGRSPHISARLNILEMTSMQRLAW